MKVNVKLHKTRQVRLKSLVINRQLFTPTLSFWYIINKEPIIDLTLLLRIVRQTNSLNLRRAFKWLKRIKWQRLHKERAKTVCSREQGRGFAKKGF